MILDSILPALKCWLSVLVVVLMWNIRLVAIWRSLGGTQNTDRADLTQSLFVITQIMTVLACTLALLWIEVRLMESELKHAALTDLLIGVLNRRAMRLRFVQEVGRSKRRQQKFGLALFDIDHFKRINDTYGHYVGDDVLRQVARAMGRSKRSEDVLGRIGGEEFLVILPSQDRDSSLSAAERLRKAVEDSESDPGSAAPGATVSGGVALYPDDGEDWDHLYMVADHRMYRAKESGRNQI